ncbi:MAG: ATP-binding domain-containing protein, partial [Kiritimatiellae bacterium]|nr:ATP-binding domain-containing protein [Kiritimatiellia bacterium]
VRRGPYGVDRVNDFVRSALPREAPVPVMVSRNDRDQDVRNGDVGVVLPSDRDTVWLEPASPDAPPRAVPRLLLPDLETAYATTVHKSQGSEYGTVAVVLPRTDDCPLLTREILYTAVTRTRRGVRLWASEAAVRRCASTAVDRVTGLVP